MGIAAAAAPPPQAGIERANHLDIGLYEHGRKLFCDKLRTSAALVHPMIETELNDKNVCLDFWEAAYA